MSCSAQQRRQFCDVLCSDGVRQRAFEVADAADLAGAAVDGSLMVFRVRAVGLA